MSNQENHRSSHFDLDLNKLDQHLLDQARLMYNYSQQLADAKREYARMKRKSEYVTAKVKQAIRADPSSYGVAKLTEDCLKELVVLQSKYQTVEKELEETRYQVDLLQGMVTALTDRKHSLQDFTQLWSQGYFAEPRVATDRQNREQIDERVKHEIRNRGRQP